MPLFSIPLSGLTASSTAMSAIANNLANLNTVGYKGRAFSSAICFIRRWGQRVGDPVQVGAGTGGAATAINMNPGSPNHHRTYRRGHHGQRFFRGATERSQLLHSGRELFRSDGRLSANRQWRTGAGLSRGGGAIPAGTALAPIMLDKGQINPPSATTSVQLTTNLDAGTTVGETPLSTPVTVYDSLGTAHVLNFNFTKTAAGAWNCNITIPNADVSPPAGWAASTAYNVGQMVSPPSANGHDQCTMAGTSGLRLPAHGRPMDRLSATALSLGRTWGRRPGCDNCANL